MFNLDKISSSLSTLVEALENFLTGEVAMTGLDTLLSLTVGNMVCLLALALGLGRSAVLMELLLDLVILPTD